MTEEERNDVLALGMLRNLVHSGIATRVTITKDTEPHARPGDLKIRAVREDGRVAHEHAQFTAPDRTSFALTAQNLCSNFTTMLLRKGVR